MKLNGGLLLVVLTALMPADSAFSADEVVYQVVFPIISGGAGLSMAEAPQIVWGSSWDTPGLLVTLTTADIFVKTDIGLENRNAAARMRMKIRPVPRGASTRDHQHWNGLFGDTLRVVLDLSQMSSEVPFPVGGPPDSALEQVLNCMIVNAGRDAHRPLYLDVLIEGRTGYDTFGGTYRLQPPPSRDEWAQPIWKLRRASSN